jgi:hypothetical protein
MRRGRVDPVEVTMAEQRARSVESDREGLLGGIVSHGGELAEKATSTWFGVARDIRDEIDQRISGTLSWIESSQQGMMKLLRGISGRVKKLADDSLDTFEDMAISIVRATRDTSRGATDWATSLGKAREKPEKPQQRASA